MKTSNGTSQRKFDITYFYNLNCHGEWDNTTAAESRDSQMKVYTAFNMCKT